MIRQATNIFLFRFGFARTCVTVLSLVGGLGLSTRAESLVDAINPLVGASTSTNYGEGKTIGRSNTSVSGRLASPPAGPANARIWKAIAIGESAGPPRC